MGIAPEAVYEAKSSAIGIETTMKGDDYISADFEIADDNGETYTVEWRGWLTDKTRLRTLETLRLMGWDGDDIYDDLSSAKRNKVKLDVRHETYKEKTTARVSFINGPDPDPEATEKKREARRAELKKLAKQVKTVAIDESDETPF